MSVSERHKVDSVMDQSRHGIAGSHLLASTLGSGGDKDTSVLARESTLSPESTGLVNEGLPLGWEVAVTGWDAEEEGVVVLEDGDVFDHWVIWLRWGVHLGEDFLWEGLWDPEERGRLATA